MEGKKSSILKGLTTVSFFATEHEKAVKWYADFLETEPYFNMPGYSEFRIGDYQHELGIIDSNFAPENMSIKPTNAVVFWHVYNLQVTLDRLLLMGAKEFAPITNRSKGFITASVVNPFGNILGIMYNPHYLEILSSLKK